jgi:hypothetical protein
MLMPSLLKRRSLRPDDEAIRQRLRELDTEWRQLAV